MNRLPQKFLKSVKNEQLQWFVTEAIVEVEGAILMGTNALFGAYTSL